MLCYPRNYVVVLKSKLDGDPGTSPLLLEDFKLHAKIDGTDEDTLVQSYIDAATNQAQLYTRRTLLTGSYIGLIDRIPGQIQFDITPVDIDSIVVKYYDSDNEIQTLAPSEYVIKDYGNDEYLVIEFNGTMPSTYNRYDAVQIEFDAGYEECPEPILQAIRMQASAYYENRQSEIVGSATHLIENGFYQTLFPYKML